MTRSLKILLVTNKNPTDDEWKQHLINSFNDPFLDNLRIRGLTKLTLVERADFGKIVSDSLFSHSFFLFASALSSFLPLLPFLFFSSFSNWYIICSVQQSYEPFVATGMIA